MKKFSVTFLTLLTVLMLSMCGCVDIFRTWEPSDTLNQWEQSAYYNKFDYSEYENMCEGDDCLAFVCTHAGDRGLFGLMALFTGWRLSEQVCSLVQVGEVYDSKSVTEGLSGTRALGLGFDYTLKPNKVDWSDVHLFMLGTGYTFSENMFLNTGETIPLIADNTMDCFPHDYMYWMDKQGYNNTHCDVYNHVPATSSLIALQYLPVSSDGTLVTRPSGYVAKKYLKNGILPIYTAPYTWFASADKDKKQRHKNSLINAVNQMNADVDTTSLFHPNYQGVGPVMIMLGPRAEYGLTTLEQRIDMYCYLRSVAVELKQTCPKCLIGVHIPSDTVVIGELQDQEDDMLGSTKVVNTSETMLAAKILVPYAYENEVKDLCATKYPKAAESCYGDNELVNNPWYPEQPHYCVDFIATTVQYNNADNCDPVAQWMQVVEAAKLFKNDRKKPFVLINAGGFTGGGSECAYTNEQIAEYNKFYISTIQRLVEYGVIAMVMPSMSADQRIIESAMLEGYNVYNPYYVSEEQGLFDREGNVNEAAGEWAIRGYKMYYTARNAQPALLMPEEQGAVHCNFMSKDMSAAYMSKDYDADVVNWQYNLNDWQFDHPDRMITIGMDPFLEHVKDAKHKCGGTNYKMQDLLKSAYAEDINEDLVDLDTMNRTGIKFWPMYQGASILGFDPWLLWSVYMAMDNDKKFSETEFRDWTNHNPDNFIKMMKAKAKAEKACSDNKEQWFETKEVSEESFFDISDYLEDEFEEGTATIIKNYQDYHWAVNYLTFCEYAQPGCIDKVKANFKPDCPCEDNNGIIPYILDSVDPEGKYSECAATWELGRRKVLRSFAWYTKVADKWGSSDITGGYV